MVLNDAVTEAVLENWRTAPIDERLKAMLGYLEKLTLSSEEVHTDDVVALHAAGISDQAIVEAIYVCVLLNIIDRIADALNFAIPPRFTSKSAKIVLKRGYKF